VSDRVSTQPGAGDGIRTHLNLVTNEVHSLEMRRQRY